VVVSNRVAPVEEGKQQAGGLAVAVQEALRRDGGIWFGWNGAIAEGPDEPLQTTQHGRITYAMLGLSQRDLDDYYSGYANSTLWPLFHHRLDLASFSDRTWEGYQRVNRLFAEKLVPLLQAGDRVWVHDYHLIPLGEYLRELGLPLRLGFFLHTPWPAPELLVALPAHAALVRSLASYDLVGFQTPDDLRSLANYVRYEAGGSVHEAGDLMRLEAFGRQTMAGAFPISIDTAELTTLARHAGQTRYAQRLRDSLVGRGLIIGVDRLDYSKGLPQRFEAFHQLLQNYPANRGQVSFMQIAPPSRSDVPEYVAIRKELEALAGHINGRFAEFDWVPIRYLNKSFSRRVLAGFYREAAIGLVTPLRDGMNLVAKEYVACQDPERPGVLVLSRFAGAARELAAALIVNPYDVRAVADNLQRALTMGLEERKERYEAMMSVLRVHDIAHWREAFLTALGEAPGQKPEQAGRRAALRASRP
jgi:trehalose 6-phosphate synthase